MMPHSSISLQDAVAHRRLPTHGSTTGLWTEHLIGKSFETMANAIEAQLDRICDGLHGLLPQTGKGRLILRRPAHSPPRV
jgi:hypothetical protein